MRGRKAKLKWQNAPDIKKRVYFLVDNLELSHIKKSRIFCYRSTSAKTRAVARVWGLGRIWQQSLRLEPAYALEVVSERFDRLGEQEKDMVLIHELLHIPKTFSGALLPHRRRGGVNDRWAHELYARLEK